MVQIITLFVEKVSLENGIVVLKGQIPNLQEGKSVTIRFTKDVLAAALTQQGLAIKENEFNSSLPRRVINFLTDQTINFEVENDFKGTLTYTGVGIQDVGLVFNNKNRVRGSGFIGWPDPDETVNFTPIRLTPKRFIPRSSKESYQWRIGYAVLDTPLQYIKQSRTSYIVEEPVLRGRDSIKINTGNAYESITLSYTAEGPEEIKNHVQKVLEQILINPIVVMEGGPFGDCRRELFSLDPPKEIPYNDFIVRNVSISTIPSFPGAIQVNLNVDPFLWEAYLKPIEGTDNTTASNTSPNRQLTKNSAICFDDFICYPLYKLWCNRAQASKYYPSTRALNGKLKLGFPRASALEAIDTFLTNQRSLISKDEDSKIYQSLRSLLRDSLDTVTSDQVKEIKFGGHSNRLFLFKISDSRAFDRWTGRKGNKAPSSFKGLTLWTPLLNKPQIDSEGNRLPNGSYITDSRFFKPFYDGVSSSDFSSSVFDTIIDIKPYEVESDTFRSKVQELFVQTEMSEKGISREEALVNVTNLVSQAVENPVDYFAIVVSADDDLIPFVKVEQTKSLDNDRSFIPEKDNSNIVKTLLEKESMDVVLDIQNLEDESIIIESVSASKVNNIGVVSNQIDSLPMHTYMGSMGTVVTIVGKCFEGVKSGKDLLYQIKARFDERALRVQSSKLKSSKSNKKYGNGRSEAAQFLIIENEITDLMGVSFVMPVTLDFESVDSQPGVWQFSLTFIEYDPRMRESERLKFLPTTSQLLNNPLEYGEGQFENSTLQKAQDWFDLQGQLGLEEVYPDLELPTRSELNSWIKSCSKIGANYLNSLQAGTSHIELDSYDKSILEVIKDDFLSKDNARKMSLWPRKFNIIDQGLYSDPDFYIYYHSTQSFGNTLDALLEDTFGKPNSKGEAQGTQTSPNPQRDTQNSTESSPGFGSQSEIWYTPPTQDFKIKTASDGTALTNVQSKTRLRETDPVEHVTHLGPLGSFGLGQDAKGFFEGVIDNIRISTGEQDQELRNLQKQAGEEYQSKAQSEGAWWQLEGIKKVGYINLIDLSIEQLLLQTEIPDEEAILEENDPNRVDRNSEMVSKDDEGWRRFFTYEWRRAVAKQAFSNGYSSPLQVSWVNQRLSVNNFLAPARPMGWATSQINNLLDERRNQIPLEIQFMPYNQSNTFAGLLNERESIVYKGRTLSDLQSYQEVFTSNSSTKTRYSGNFDEHKLLKQFGHLSHELTFIERTVLQGSLRRWAEQRSGENVSVGNPTGSTPKQRIIEIYSEVEQIAAKYAIDPNIIRAFYLVRSGFGLSQIRTTTLGGWGQLDIDKVHPSSSPGVYLETFAKTFSRYMREVKYPTFALIMTDLELTDKRRSSSDLNLAISSLAAAAVRYNSVNGDPRKAEIIQNEIKSLPGVNLDLINLYWIKYIELVRNFGAYSVPITDVFFDPLSNLVLMDLGMNLDQRAVRTTFSPTGVPATLSMDRTFLERPDILTVGNIRDENQLPVNLSAEQLAQFSQKIRLGLSPASEGSVYGLLHDLRKYSCHGRLLKAFPSFSVVIINDGFYWRGGTSKLWDQFYTRTALSGIEVFKSRHQPAHVCTVTFSNMFHNLTRYSAAEVLQQELILQERENFRAAIMSLSTIGKVWDEYIFKNPSSELLKVWQKNHLNALVLSPGARLHLRMGYGSNASKLPVIFNGTIVETPVAQDAVTVVAVGDGVELEKPSVNKLYPSVDGFAYSDGGVLGQAKAPINIVTEALVNLEGVGSTLTQGKFFRDFSHGIAHFGDVYFDGIRWNPVELSINLYNSRSTTLEQSVPAIRNFFNTNAIFNWDDTTEFSVEVSEPTPWKVIEVCRRACMDFVASAEPFATWSTVFFGKWWWPFHYQFNPSILDYSVSNNIVGLSDQQDNLTQNTPWSREEKDSPDSYLGTGDLRQLDESYYPAGDLNTNSISFVNVTFHSEKDKVLILRKISLLVREEKLDPAKIFKIQNGGVGVLLVDLLSPKIRLVITEQPSTKSWKIQRKINLSDTDFSASINDSKMNPGLSTADPDSMEKENATIRYGLKVNNPIGNFTFNYLDYLKDVEALTATLDWKPYSQVYIIHSYLNLLNNNISTDGTQVYTDAMGRFLYNGVLTSTGVDKTISWCIDDDIHPGSRKTMIVDTGILLTWLQRGLPGQTTKLVEWLPFIGDTVKGTATTPAINNGVMNALLDTVKEMYQGWVTITAQPTIKPRDLIMFKDIKTGLTGPMMVKEVIHKLDSQVGYVTMVSPDCIALPHSSVLGSNLITSLNSTVLGKLGAIWAAKSLYIFSKHTINTLFGVNARRDQKLALQMSKWDLIQDLVDNRSLKPLTREEIVELKISALEDSYNNWLNLTDTETKTIVKQLVEEGNEISFDAVRDSVRKASPWLGSLGESEGFTIISQLRTNLSKGNLEALESSIENLIQASPEIEDIIKKIRVIDQSDYLDELTVFVERVRGYTDETKETLIDSFMNTFRNADDFNRAVEEGVFNTEITGKLDRLLRRADELGLFGESPEIQTLIDELNDVREQARLAGDSKTVSKLDTLIKAARSAKLEDLDITPSILTRMAALLKDQSFDLIPSRTVYQRFLGVIGTIVGGIWNGSVGPYVDVTGKTVKGGLDGAVKAAQALRDAAAAKAVADAASTTVGAAQVGTANSSTPRQLRKIGKDFLSALKSGDMSGVKASITDVGELIREKRLADRVRKGAKSGVMGLRILGHAANPIGSIALDAFIFIIGDSIGRAETLKMRARQCAKILPLFVNGVPWVAGIRGHEGGVIGDEPGWYDRFLMGLLGGSSNPEDNPLFLPEGARQAAFITSTLLFGIEVPDYRTETLPQDRAYLRWMEESSEEE
jgi:hypothetical protein